MKPDLESFYSQLDLRPNCSWEEFQRAYRRQVRELHPDRHQRELQSAEQRAQLRHLISLHAKVDRFYRRYGRMPGANGNPQALIAPRRTNTPSSSLDSPGNDRPVQLAVILMVLLLALLILGSYWNWLTSRKADSSQHLASPVAVSIG